MKSLMLASLFTAIASVAVTFTLSTHRANKVNLEHQIVKHYLDSPIHNEFISSVSKNSDTNKSNYLYSLRDPLSLYFGLQKCSLLNELPFGSDIESFLHSANQLASSTPEGANCNEACAKMWLIDDRFADVSCSDYEGVFEHALGQGRFDDKGV